MLDCKFPRPVGDIGNARTFPFPVQYQVLTGIPAADLTRHGKPEAVEALVEAARRLEALGVKAILTSCGLLIRYQQTLARSVSIPVASSALILLPTIGALLPSDKKIAVIAASNLPVSVFQQVGWGEPDRLVLAGLEDCPHFTSSIMEAQPPYELDTEAVFSEVLAVCQTLKDEEPGIGAFLLECTNLAPYTPRLKESLGLPVFDVNHLAHLLHAASS
jgi:Asp/Glu/hydantoin racemase